MDLDYNFPAGHRIVMHIRIKVRKTTRRKVSHLALVKSIPHPDLEGPADDRDVLSLRMPVWGDAISVRHPQSHGVVSAAGTWIALKNCELRACGDKRRCRTVGNGIGR